MSALAAWRERLGSAAAKWPRRAAVKGFKVGASASGFESSMLGQEGFDRARRATRRWAMAGVAMGVLVALIAFAPASWLARAVAQASSEHLLLTESRGTVWSGSAVMVLTGGTGSRDAMALPGRLSWRLGLSGMTPQIQLVHACCLNGTVALKVEPGFRQFNTELLPPAGWVAQWPTGWLAGLGTPFNTMQLGGAVRLVSPGFTLRWVAGRWQMDGRADVEFNGVSSRISTLEQLGSYRLSLTADPANAGTSLVTLTTVDGALQLTGSGTWNASGFRFRGEARSGLADDAALNNLLNIIGRRDGARSLISIG